MPSQQFEWSESGLRLLEIFHSMINKNTLAHIENERISTHTCFKKDCYFCYVMQPISKSIPNVTPFMLAAKSNNKPAWSDEERAILIDNNTVRAQDLMALLPGRTCKAIMSERCIVRRLKGLVAVRYY